MDDHRSFEAPPYDQWPQAQPYAVWAEARARGGVIELAPNPWDPGARSYLVATFAEAQQVLRDATTFSSGINADTMEPFMGEFLVGMDGDAHRRYRNLVAAAFRRSALERWKDELVGPVIHGLLDAIVPAGRADLVAQLTSRYPVQVICGIVGVPLADHGRFQAWAEAINYGPLDPEAGLAASAAMQAYLEPLVAARRAEPTGDLLSELVHAEVDGERLSDGKLYGFLRLLLPAGAETTFNVMGSALLSLASDADLRDRVATDRALLGEFIEEALRWETSVTMVSRRATTDTELAGTTIPAGASLTVLLGSANRDESRCPHGDHLDVDRGSKNHISFGTGPHQCLGMHLARIELEVGLAAVLERLPALRLDPTAPAPAVSGYAFRGPRQLAVLFDAG